MNLFEHDEDKARQRIGAKMRKLADETQAALDESNRIDAVRYKKIIEFQKETSRRAILADYKSLNEEPIYTAGLLVSPQLVAYGRNQKTLMAKHAIEADAREKKERGNARSNKRR